MAQASRTRNSMLNLITGLGGQLLFTVIKFLTRTVFIWTLGKEYLGINGLFSNILTMLSLTELGLDTAINFKLYKPLVEHDDKRVRVLMKFYKQAYRMVGIVIIMLGLCLVPLLPFLINDYESLESLGINAVLVFMLYLLQSASSYLFWAYRSAVMKANQHQYVLSVSEYAIHICMSIAQIAVLLFLRSFMLYTAVGILFNIIKNCVNAVIAKKYYPQFFEKEEDCLSRREVFGLLRDCGILFISKLDFVITTATDNLVLSAFLGLAAVGLYSNYLLCYNTGSSILWKFCEAFSASLGNLFAQDEIEKKHSLFKTMNYVIMILYGTAGVGIAVCSNDMIRAWIGQDYVIAQPFAILLGLQMVLLGMKVNLNQIRIVGGAFRQGWYRPAIGAILNVTVSVGMVRIWGISGVVVGTIAASLMANIALDPNVIYKYSFNGRWRLSEYYKKNAVYVAVLAAVCLFDICVCRCVSFSSEWVAVLCKVLITGTSVPLAFAVVFWKTRECSYIRAALLGMIRKQFHFRRKNK